MGPVLQHSIAGFVSRRFPAASLLGSRSCVLAPHAQPQCSDGASNTSLPLLSIPPGPRWNREAILLRTVHAETASCASACSATGRRQRTFVPVASLRDEAETSAISHVETATFVRREEGNVDHRTNLVLGRKSTSAVEAGRSKAKKGAGSGGRIERRPPPPQKVPRKKSGSLDTDDTASSKKKETAKGDGSVESKQSGAKAGKASPIEDDDISWLLEDNPRAAGDKKNTKLVGGWGRDKSMQREVPVGSEQRIRGARGGKSRTSTTGKKKTPAQGTIPEDDPSVRYPDEHYIDGPYGPYAWRGVTLGKPIEGNLITTQVVFFSNVADDKEDQDREQYNCTVDYTDQVDKLNEDIGVLYYYVFARSKYGPRQEPWRDWTLAAQVAVESREELDQRVLFSKLDSNIQETLLKCVAWVRPDLIYVRKPRLQLRLEAQEKFMTELLDMLNEQDTPDSYYGKLCRILKIEPTSSSEAVKLAYEALNEEGKLRCLEHLLTQHPVKLLASARYDRIVRGSGEDMTDETDGVELSMDTSAPVEDGEDQGVQRSTEALNDLQDVEGGLIDEGKGLSGQEPQEPSESLAIQKYNPEKYRFEPVPGELVRSAIRPFNYSDFLEEIATIHNILHGQDTSTEWIREAVNSR
ncbi:hypothetical protein Mapa_000453 [Marchantia paleacea]|nr:hypothetical protein Mapa_000453 [Marchantia paleacea]